MLLGYLLFIFMFLRVIICLSFINKAKCASQTWASSWRLFSVLFCPVKQAYRVYYVETVNRMVNLWIKYLFVLSNLPFLIYLHTSTDNVCFFFRFVGDGRAGRIPATWQARRTKNARTQRLSRVGRRCFYV